MQTAESGAGHTPLLEARGLSKRYGATQALDALDLAIEPGEVYCLLGPNGAGKTTTINLFLGFVSPSGGQALVSGLDVATHDRETKRRLAYIPEQVMLYRNLSDSRTSSTSPLWAGRDRWGASGSRTSSSKRASSATRSTAACPSTPRACGRRSGSRSPWPRKPTPSCSTSRRPVSTPRPPTSSRPSSSGSGIGASRCSWRRHDLFRAKETGTRVGIMRYGSLVTEMGTDEIGHADLERVYLEHMHD